MQGELQRVSCKGLMLIFNEIYSLVMSGIIFRYSVSLAVQNCLSMQLMGVVITYLYGSLDSKIYMNAPDGISISNPKANSNMFLC
jgi:hypothetical protein